MNEQLEREILADVAEIKERIESALDAMLASTGGNFCVWAENPTWQALRDSHIALEKAQRLAGVELPEPATFNFPTRVRRVSKGPEGVQ